MLHLTGNLINDFSFLAGRSNLVSLSLDNNRIHSFRPPEVLPSLTFLDLSWNPLLDLGFIPFTPNLQQLILNGVGGSALVMPSGAPDLHQMNLYNTSPRLVLAPDLQGPIQILCGPLPAVIVPAGLPERGFSIGDGSSPAIKLIEYPLAPELLLSRADPSNLTLNLKAYPGVYDILRSSDLTHWTRVGTLTNALVENNLPIADFPLTPFSFYRIAK
jgi:hypothetical protein